VFEAINNSTLLMLLVIVGILIAFNLIMMAFARKNAERSPAKSRTIEPSKAPSGLWRENADQIGVQIEEFWREVSARTDDKTRKLTGLIEEADQRIEELRRLSRGEG
jgi:hypothetical protein